jgi:uncharacterized protein with von Willebrand factor type A (vWA) domain
MISFLVVLSVLIYVVGFVLLWREIKALRKAQSEKVQDPATALLEKLLGSDSEVAKTLSQIHENVLVVSRSEVVLANNQQLIVNELGALAKKFADLAYGTRILNAAAKRTAAEEATRAATPDPRASLREQIQTAAELAERARPRETVEQMQARSGLIAPGKCPLPGGIPHPQDSLPKK